MTAKQPTAADVTIQVDTDGTQAGIFNADSDPHISFCHQTNIDGKQHDGWLLVYRDADGEARSHVLNAKNKNNAHEALQEARSHLAGKAN
jgi:hypothetical protein